MGTVDLYCERTTSAFWAEPVNAATNVAFLLAALAAWRLSSGRPSPPIELSALVFVMALIGIGSFLFHTLATTWARWLDIIPILIFQVLFLWLYLRSLAGLSRVGSLLILAVFFAAAMTGRQFAGVWNGAPIYAPALLTLLALGSHQAMTAKAGRYDLLIASAIFVASLFFRTIDNAVCSSFPLGTHFGWHIANGLVVYLSYRALFRQTEQTH